MGDYRLQAFIDLKASPVETAYVQTSRCIDEYAPKLAERAGLGRFLDRGHTRWAIAHLQYENGSILVHREIRTNGVSGYPEGT
jgi:hypothetical protein